MMMECDEAESDLDSGSRETVSHVASLICQNLSQKVETVIVKGQNPQQWGLCRISLVGYKYPVRVVVRSFTLETTLCTDVMFGLVQVMIEFLCWNSFIHVIC
jgi:hypothetical protein